MNSDWKEITAEWQGEMTFIGKNQTGGSVQMGMLDGEPGVSPMELLLVGVAGCTAIDVVHILKKMRQPIEDLKVKVRGKRAEDHPKVYTRIELKYLVKGQGLKEKDVRRAIELSNTKFCSAAIMLGKTAEIVTSYEITESDGAQS